MNEGDAAIAAARALIARDEKIGRLEAELVETAKALDRIRDVMSDYLSDECVPMSRLFAALDGEET